MSYKRMKRGNSFFFKATLQKTTCINVSLFRLLHKTAKKRLLSLSCLSVCPYGTTRLPLDGYLWIFIYMSIFRNLSRKCKFHWNWTRITGALHEDQHTYMILSVVFPCMLIITQLLFQQNALVFIKSTRYYILYFLSLYS
jgi:hypothetical protein